jgi:hypothetical protein
VKNLMTTLRHRSSIGMVILRIVMIPIIATAQSTCPTYSNSVYSGVTDKGMSNDANINVVVVDTSAGDFDDTQVQAVTDAIDSLAGISGNNQDYTVTNTDTAPAGPPTTVTDTNILNPTAVVEIATQSDINATDAGCVGAAACTISTIATSGASKGTAVYSVTKVLPTFAGSQLQAIMLHEFGHGVFGWDDCTGANCTNSMMQTPYNSATSPATATSCDQAQAKICGH